MDFNLLIISVLKLLQKLVDWIGNTAESFGWIGDIILIGLIALGIYQLLKKSRLTLVVVIFTLIGYLLFKFAGGYV